MKNRILILFIFSSFCINANNSPIFKTNFESLKEIVINEFENFKPVCKIIQIELTQLEFTESLPSHINKDQNIVINLDQIQKYTIGKDIVFTKKFVSFVIAHEIGHKMQIKNFSLSDFRIIQGEENMFYECHADIIAGFLVSRLMMAKFIEFAKNNPEADFEKIKKADQYNLTDVYSQIIQMDKENTLIQTHPSNTDRLIAFKSGKLAAEIMHVYYRNMEDEPMSEKDLEDLERSNKLYKGFSKALGYDPYSTEPAKKDFKIWAIQEAVRITNQNNLLAKNLVIYNTKIKWDKIDPIVDFSFDVYNKNDVEICFNGRVFTEIVLRKNLQDDIASAPFDGYSFNHFIKANDIITISGRLNCASNDEYSSRIVIPGDTKSLYYITDPKKLISDKTPVECFDVDLSINNADFIEELIYLINYSYTRRNSFENLKRGIGRSEATKKDEILEKYITFQPSFVSDKDDFENLYFQEIDDQIIFNSKTVIDNKTAAISNYNMLNQTFTFDPMFNQFGYRKCPEIPGALWWCTSYYLQEEQVFTVTLQYDDIANKYDLRVEVNGL